MSNTDEKNTPLTEAPEEPAVSDAAKTDGSDALDSFLSREPKKVTAKKSGKTSPKRSIIVLIVAIVVVGALVAIILILRNAPQPAEGDEGIPPEAWTVATVDEAGVHQVTVPLNDAGEPRQNGYGTLIDYNPFLIRSIRVDNPSGSFLLHVSGDGVTETEYVLDGFEDFVLETGMPDNVANDAKGLRFLTIASVGKDLDAYGLSAPRARAYITYTDGTVAIVNVGDDAPSSAGTYVCFGSGQDVFLVSSEAVDAFFYSPAEFISRAINDSPDTTENAEFSRITLTGSHYPRPIILEPNTDEALSYYYRMTSPAEMFADAVMSAGVSGDIRGLTADSVAAVNTLGADEAGFLAEYGLSGECYAEVTAEYPDATIRLRAGAPDGDGYVYLVNADDPRIVYQIKADSVSWADTSAELFTPETVLSVRRTSLDSITITAGEKTCAIDVDTRTQTVDTTDGGTEEVTTTEAYLDDKRLGDDSFTILLQNLIEMKNAGITDAPAEKALIEIRYAYTTGRAPDTIVVYQSDSQSCAVALNGAVIGSVAKSYATSLVENVSDLIAGKVPKSL